MRSPQELKELWQKVAASGYHLPSGPILEALKEEGAADVLLVHFPELEHYNVLLLRHDLDKLRPETLEEVRKRFLDDPAAAVYSSVIAYMIEEGRAGEKVLKHSLESREVTLVMEALRSPVVKGDQLENWVRGNTLTYWAADALMSNPQRSCEVEYLTSRTWAQDGATLLSLLRQQESWAHINGRGALEVKKALEERLQRAERGSGEEAWLLRVKSNLEKQIAICCQGAAEDTLRALALNWEGSLEELGQAARELQ